MRYLFMAIMAALCVTAVAAEEYVSMVDDEEAFLEYVQGNTGVATTVTVTERGYEPVLLNDLTYMVKGAEVTDIAPRGYTSRRSDYLTVQLQVTNNNDRLQSFKPFKFLRVVDSDEEVYAGDYKEFRFGKNLQPGESFTGTANFEVPSGASDLSLWFTQFSSREEVLIPLQEAAATMEAESACSAGSTLLQNGKDNRVLGIKDIRTKDFGERGQIVELQLYVQKLPRESWKSYKALIQVGEKEENLGSWSFTEASLEDLTTEECFTGNVITIPLSITDFQNEKTLNIRLMNGGREVVRIVGEFELADFAN